MKFRQAGRVNMGLGQSWGKHSTNWRVGTGLGIQEIAGLGRVGDKQCGYGWCWEKFIGLYRCRPLHYSLYKIYRWKK